MQRLSNIIRYKSKLAMYSGVFKKSRVSPGVQPYVLSQTKKGFATMLNLYSSICMRRSLSSTRILQADSGIDMETKRRRC